MRRVYMFIITLFISMTVCCFAETSAEKSIDFIISQEMNMIGYEGFTEIIVNPLVIENCSENTDINIENIYIHPLNGWELINKDSDFDKMTYGTKKFSLETLDGKDMSEEISDIVIINSGEKKEICLKGKISKNEEQLKTQIANLVVEIVPVFECRTVLYKDGTFVINEMLSDSISNETLHGDVFKEYIPLGLEDDYEYIISSYRPWHNEKDHIKYVKFGSNVKPRKMDNWFYGCSNLEYFDSTNLDTSKCTSTKSMFFAAGTNIKETFLINGIDNWDVSKLEDTSSMFERAGINAKEWRIGDLSEWDTSNLENVPKMFYRAGTNSSTWNVGDLGNWNVSNIKDFSYMFSNAGEEASDFFAGTLGRWDTSSASNMRYMFYYTGFSAEKWDIGDISKWNVSGVDTFDYMFYGAGKNCKNVNIGKLDWDLSNATRINDMFTKFATSTSGLDIGTLTIGGNGNYINLMKQCSNINVVIHVKNRISNAKDIFYCAATDINSGIKLVPINDEAKSWCEEMIILYGEKGTVSYGNIWI